ncbi:MAG: ergothioneine biosynthesis protein EgtB [Wenzhouxiangellaceae bacterium]
MTDPQATVATTSKADSSALDGAWNRLAEAELATHADELVAAWLAVRQASLQRVAGLDAEDLNLQGAAFASPAKWHLAHTTWFFETFLLAGEPGYAWHHPAYCELFNSYYNGIGQQYSRPQRHMLSRPTVAEVIDYRETIDQRLAALLDRHGHATDSSRLVRLLALLRLGMNHEQQHQELLLTDLLHAFSHNPLAPALGQPLPPPLPCGELQWIDFPAGMTSIGAAASDGFCFDNETPRHRQLLHGDYALASRPVSNGEYLRFINDDGYTRAEHWHSDGWAWLQQASITAPCYWRRHDGHWQQYTLAGLQPLQEHAPVSHLSWYEASAYASWCQARLPTEAEWEHAAQSPCGQHGLGGQRGQFAESGIWQAAMPASGNAALAGMFGHVWEWTASSYSPYPGFSPAAGAIGEYNGKFMANQYVLKGGSCATPESHIRSSYRNFFYPQDRWQFSGVRLARDV